VFQLSVHTLGGVIQPGETVMLIFPDADSLTVEAKVNPQHIEQVQLRQKALLRFRHSTRPRLRRSMERFLDLR